MRRPLVVAGGLAAVSLAVCLSLALVMPRCAPPYQPIPDGTYSTPPGNEYVSVHEGNILLHVLPWSERRLPHYSDITYEYTVNPDGRITIYTMTSWEALNGVGGFAWLWDGARIVQQDRRRSKEARIYSRVP